MAALCVDKKRHRGDAMHDGFMPLGGMGLKGGGLMALAGLGELRRIDSHRPAQEAILNALHSDLVIVGHPGPNGLPNDVTLETILLASGVPLLVLPNTWLGEAIGRDVLIGWNASRKARRTISADRVGCLLSPATFFHS